MTREEFRAHAAGKYVLQNKGQMINNGNLDAFVEGAILAYDWFSKAPKVPVEYAARRTEVAQPIEPKQEASQ